MLRGVQDGQDEKLLFAVLTREARRHLQETPTAKGPMPSARATPAVRQQTPDYEAMVAASLGDYEPPVVVGYFAGNERSEM